MKLEVKKKGINGKIKEMAEKGENKIKGKQGE